MLDLIRPLAQGKEVVLDLREFDGQAKRLDGVIEIVASHSLPHSKSLSGKPIVSTGSP